MSNSKISNCEQFPSERTHKVADSHEKLKNLEELLETVLPNSAVAAKESPGPADEARYDLCLSYALSSSMWTYVLIQDEDPKETAIKHEIDKIRDCMVRVQQLEDRQKRPRFVAGAAKRFVRNALFDLGEKKGATKNEEKGSG